MKEETGMGVMRSILDVEVAHHCRIVCAVNLQYLREIFKNVWAFAIGIGAHLEVSLKTCKGFVGPLQALCQGPAVSNQISPSSIGQRSPAHKA